MRWEKVPLQPKQTQEMGGGGGGGGPGKRWGHTCNAVRGGRFLYVFGGYGQDNCQTNQVHVFDSAKQTWNQPMIKGTPPTPRDSHSCTTVADNLFIFGGTDGMNPLKDLHVLDTSSHTWLAPTLKGEGPEPREGHSAALVGRQLFIFGGCGKSSDTNDEVYYNDLYILDTETFVWKRATASGTPPSTRDSHTCSSWKNKIIVTGGEDGHDYYLSDVHILDADTLIWRELNTSGQLLPPRAGHSTVAFGKNLFIFGGFTEGQKLYDDLYMLDVDTGLWTKVTTIGSGPSARFSVAGDCLDPVKGGVLVFIGGCNKSLEALDDMYFLYTGLERENRKPENLSLKKQLKMKTQEKRQCLPVPDNALLRIEASPDLRQPMPVPIYAQPSSHSFPFNQSPPPQGKKVFQAKVIKSSPEGCTIETTIDGKPLRGILFRNNQRSSHIANDNSNRKRAAGEVGGVKLNGEYNSKSKTSKPLKQDTLDPKQEVYAPGKDSTSHGHQMEAAAAAPIFKDPAPSDASQPHKVPANPEPSVAPVNWENEMKNDTRIEVSKENISTTTKGCITFSYNQDDKTPIAEENSNPSK